MVLQSAFLILDSGIILKSVHRHDFYTHPLAPGWHIDGGRDYLKVGTPVGIDFNSSVIMLSLTTDSSDEEIYAKAVWGIFNKALSIIEYKLIYELDLSDLDKIIESNKKNSVSDYIIKAVNYWKEVKSKNDTVKCYFTLKG